MIVITCSLKFNHLIMLLSALTSMKHRRIWVLTFSVSLLHFLYLQLFLLWNVTPVWHAALLFLVFCKSKFACTFNINVRLYALVVYFVVFTKLVKDKSWALRDKSGNYGHLVRNWDLFSLPLSTELNKQTHPTAFKII